MNQRLIGEVLGLQAGVIARRQVLETGGTDSDIERMLRRRMWARLHEGVYVDHTGPPTLEQWAWAAVLYHWPAALAGCSALEAHGIRRSGRLHAVVPVVHVAIAARRSVGGTPGISVTRIVHFDRVSLLHLGPPRVRVEHALLDVASRFAKEAKAVALLGDACQTRHTTAERLIEALGARPKLRHRRLLLLILHDVANGAYSVLERRYLAQVERPHGLPTAQRQRHVRSGKNTAYRDVDYVGLGTVVELDGRLGHEGSADRWVDLDRDLASSIRGDLTVRVGWKQVLEPCRLAAVVAHLLIVRGWSGRPRSCGPGCPVGAIRADLPAPDAGGSTGFA